MSRLQVAVDTWVGAFRLDVAFSSDAEVTALMGASGAGKTLTLRAMAGLLHPSRGRIVVGERTWLDTDRGICVPARRRGVGYVFQQYALFPHLDVGGNVAYGLAGLPRAEREGRAARAIEMVGLNGRERAYPAELSGGQQQRVALARALAPGPELLLLDEPFGALDPPLRRRMRAMLVDVLAEVDVPAVLVTHDLEDARALAGRVVLLEQGQVVQQGQGEVIHLFDGTA